MAVFRLWLDVIRVIEPELPSEFCPHSSPGHFIFLPICTLEIIVVFILKGSWVKWDSKTVVH